MILWGLNASGRSCREPCQCQILIEAINVVKICNTKSCNGSILCNAL